jgi:DNA-binding transcriptional ArsR family regulator
MPEKIGDALKRAITQEKAVEEVEKDRKDEESLLLNPTRQKIFQFLCKNPCSKLRTIANSLELAVPTADWHLKKLAEKKIVSVRRVGKNKIFYPSEMIDPKDIEVLALLSGDKARLICSAIADNPGISQGELGKRVGMYQQEIGWYTSKLTENNVLNRIIDGKYRRYYLSEELEKILHSNRKRLNHFKKILIRFLKSDGMNPEIIRSRGDTLIIQIGDKKEKTLLRINLNLIPKFDMKDQNITL